jgi:hypothetical protein
MHRQELDSLPHFGVSTRAQTLADKLAQQRLAQASLGPPYRALRRWAGRRRLKQLHRESSRRIVVGAAGVYPRGWIPTDADFLDLLRPQDWSASVFEKSGFTVSLLEHFDEDGRFHSVDWDPPEGMIHRSRRFDERNGEGRELAYTSIILDASKAS